jgi:hypothetical protein
MPFDVSVKPGDVLLFRGDSWISRAIRWFDHSEVNHAAIALDSTQLAEATGHGLAEGGISLAYNSNLRTIVRRHADDLDGIPLVAVARKYLGDGVPYGYHQIVLLAILSATRRIPLPWVAKRLVRSALDHAANVISSYLDGNSGTKFMICSEYVYRCYDEASGEVPDPYDVALDLGGPAELALGAPGEGTTFLDWSLKQSAAVKEAEVLASDTATPLAGGLDLAGAEAELDRLIQEYAVVAASADPYITSDLADGPLPLATAPAALADPEPTPEELLAAHIRLSRALEATREDPEPLEPLGIGTDVLKGLLQGLTKVQASPDFVTPGDLLVRATSLRTVADVVR